MSTDHDPTPWSGTNISCALLAAGLTPCQIVPAPTTPTPTTATPTTATPTTATAARSRLHCALLTFAKCTAPSQSLVSLFDSGYVARCDSQARAVNHCEIRDSVWQGVITVSTDHNPAPWSGTNIITRCGASTLASVYHGTCS